MGIFSRLRDIISSNVNAMLEKAENPEKLIKLMLQEMEDTLIEIKAQCAQAMAHGKTVERALGEARERGEEWGRKARLAMEKGREDLAREALLEKRRYQNRAESLEGERTECDSLIEQYKSDITAVEAKMTAVREKQKMLVQRHLHARAKRRAQENIRWADGADALVRFESFERRIDRMEAEADLVNFGRQPAVEKEFEALEGDEELEREVQALKDKVAGEGKGDAPGAPGAAE